MFLEPYPTHYCGIDRYKVRPDLIETHLFRFKDRNNHTYIIRAEKYPHNVYAIKFYLKAHKLSENKYSLTTGFNIPIRIIGTCLHIMIRLYRRDTNVSFVIIGANSIGEVEANTKRFRVYKRIMGRFFAAITFTHREDLSKSAYILVNNRQLLNDSDLSQKISSMI